jgi:hypothetical protein
MNNKAKDTKSRKNTRRRPRDTSLGHIPLRAADAKRSVQNILEWNAYLPSDCVRTMVRMGWDYTT